MITINGRGTVFPAGLGRFTFSGIGGTEIDVPEATSIIKVRVPLGTASGPFGFSIGPRRFIGLENSLPSSNVFQAWRFEAPGFRVVDPSPIPPTLLEPPPNEHQPPNG